MKYEIVKLKEKKVAGIKARTNNAAPDMGMVIGQLWSDFFEKGIWQAIEGKKNEKTLGIYTEYEGNEEGDYSVLAACETEGSGHMPEEAVTAVIPAGTYARFAVEGKMPEALAVFWQELWSMELPRAFVCDFEEYQNSGTAQACIHVYIGLKE